jgi:SPP1 family phage portal protein
MIYKYDYKPGDRLIDEQIVNYISMFQINEQQQLQDLFDYSIGQNPAIMRRIIEDARKSGAPDWKVPVSYGKKIIDTITGYMYKPGLIWYNFIDIQLQTSAKKVFLTNNEPIKTSLMGKSVSTYGKGYELFYLEDSKVKWVICDPREIIPVYDYSIDEKLAFFIRFYTRDKYQYIEIYYPDEIQFLRKETNNESNKLESWKPTVTNLFQEPPLNKIKNNEEEIGDFQSVTALIDANDILMSDSMNEFTRFAWAYLRLVGMKLGDNDAEALKYKRVFEDLQAADDVTFLTKDINVAFIDSMKLWIKQEIHKQTHIPDFLDQASGGAMSGVALDRLLYDLEFVCATKEMFFREGLYNRFRLIDKFENVTQDDFIINDITINFDRNRPADKLQDMQLYTGYKQAGGIADVTLLTNFASFVNDPEKELEDYNKQTEDNMMMFNYGSSSSSSSTDSST